MESTDPEEYFSKYYQVKHPILEGHAYDGFVYFKGTEKQWNSLDVDEVMSKVLKCAEEWVNYGYKKEINLDDKEQDVSGIDDEYIRNLSYLPSHFEISVFQVPAESKLVFNYTGE